MSRVLSSLWSKPGFCFPVPRHIAMEVVSRVGPEPWGWLLLCGCPWARDSSFCGGAVAAGSQQAAVPWHQGALELVLCGDRPRGDAQCWLCPTANAQQGLALRSRGAHMDGHMLVWAPPGHGPTFLGIQKKCVWAHQSTPLSLAAAACPSAWHRLVTPAPRWHELPWVLSAQHTPACSNLGPAQRVYGAFSDTQAPPLNIPLLRCPHGCNTA